MRIAGRGDEPLPLRDVKLPVGLKLRGPHDFGRRGALRCLDELLVGDGNPQLAVLPLEQEQLDQLIYDLILGLLLLFPGERPARLPANLLIGGLECRVVLGEADLAAVDFENDIASPTKDLGNLSVRQPADEGDGDDPKHGLRNFAHRAHHTALLLLARGQRGHKCINRNKQTQATEPVSD